MVLMDSWLWIRGQNTDLILSLSHSQCVVIKQEIKINIKKSLLQRRFCVGRFENVASRVHIYMLTGYFPSLHIGHVPIPGTIYDKKQHTDWRHPFDDINPMSFKANWTENWGIFCLLLVSFVTFSILNGSVNFATRLTLFYVSLSLPPEVFTLYFFS